MYITSWHNIVSPDNEPVASVVKSEVTSSLVTAKEFSIGNESASFVNELIILKVAEHAKASTAANITKQSKTSSTWVQFKKFSSSNNEKKITKGEWLTDNHIGFAQLLIHHNLNGLQSPIFLNHY